MDTWGMHAGFVNGSSRRCGHVELLGLIVASALALSPMTARTANFTVTATHDSLDVAPGDGACADASGACTLRAAVMEANATPGEDEVLLPAGQLTLSIPGDQENLALTGDIDVTDALVLSGAGPDITVLTSAATFDDRLLQFHPECANMVIRGLTLTGGRLDGRRDPVTLDGSRGLVMLSRSPQARLADLVVRDNIALEETWTIVDVEAPGGNATVEGCAVVDNHVLEWAQAIRVSGHDVTMSDCLVARNESGWYSSHAVYMGATNLTVERTWIDSNGRRLHMGGIAMFALEEAIMRDCSVTNNRNWDGGAGVTIANEVRAALTNCTIAYNESLSEGGSRAFGAGIKGGDQYTYLFLRNCTITGNRVEGEQPAISLTYVEASNSIIAGNVSTDDPAAEQYYAAGGSHGYNIFGNVDTSRWTLTHPSDIFNADPLLGPLQDNGGFTPTLLPLEGSPAIDGGDPAGCRDQLGNLLRTDQRGLPRPIDGNADGTDRCDIGAVELQVPYGPDDDGDTIPDLVDCAPSDPAATRLPGEPELRVAKTPATNDASLTWTDQAPHAGTGTRYDVASALLSALHAARSADAPCVQRNVASPAHVDARPVSADGWYYLVRAVNACGPAAQQGWGADSLGTPRPACP